MTPQNHNAAEEVFILRNESHPMGSIEEYQVLREFMIEDQHYALLKMENHHPNDCFLFRISDNQIEEIEDELEWERISDAIDEYIYFQD